MHVHEERGFTTLVVTLFFIAGGMALFVGVTASVLQNTQFVHALENSKNSHALAEGLTEDVVYRIKNGIAVSNTEVLTEGNTTATSTLVSVIDGREVTTEASNSNLYRRLRVGLIEGQGVAFNFGMQAGTGGVIMENSSSVLGNVYANGTIIGDNNNMVFGDVISATSLGLVEEVHATGTVHAHEIRDSVIEKDAYYDTTITGTSVFGTQFPGSPDQPAAVFPIDDQMIADWEADALAAGTLTCSDGTKHVIDDDDSIGPIMVPCDLEIKNNPTITVGGVIWVQGDITIENSVVVNLNPTLGNSSVPIIADNPSDRLTSSRVQLKNSSEFNGVPGSDTSHVLIVSQNESAENGGGEIAIEVENSAEGDLLVYAAHGEILLKNNVDLHEVTAYRIHLQNSAQVVYQSGLANQLFTTGPSGGFSINSWDEVD